MTSMLLTPLVGNDSHVIALHSVFVQDIQALDTHVPYTYYELLMTHTNCRISQSQCNCYVCSPYVTGFGKTCHLRTDKYLEIHNSIIQSVISREGLKLHAYNSLQIYSYLIAIRLPTPQCRASCFPTILDFLSTPQVLIQGWWVATKWRVTAKLSNFLGEMAQNETPLHSKCHKIQLKPQPTP